MLDIPQVCTCKILKSYHFAYSMNRTNVLILRHFARLCLALDCTAYLLPAFCLPKSELYVNKMAVPAAVPPETPASPGQNRAKGTPESSPSKLLLLSKLQGCSERRGTHQADSTKAKSQLQVPISSCSYWESMK